MSDFLIASFWNEEIKIFGHRRRRSPPFRLGLLDYFKSKPLPPSLLPPSLPPLPTDRPQVATAGRPAPSDRPPTDRPTDHYWQRRDGQPPLTDRPAIGGGGTASPL